MGMMQKGRSGNWAMGVLAMACGTMALMGCAPEGEKANGSAASASAPYPGKSTDRSGPTPQVAPEKKIEEIPKLAEEAPAASPMKQDEKKSLASASPIGPEVATTLIIVKDDAPVRSIAPEQRQSGEGAQALSALGPDQNMDEPRDASGGYRRSEPSVTYSASQSQWRILGGDEPIGYLIAAPVPPPPRVEPTTFAPRSGLAWVGGSWAWANSGGWFWVPGRWVEPPAPGSVWMPSRHERHGDRMQVIQGHWVGTKGSRWVSDAHHGLTGGQSRASQPHEGFTRRASSAARSNELSKDNPAQGLRGQAPIQATVRPVEMPRVAGSTPVPASVVASKITPPAMPSVNMAQPPTLGLRGGVPDRHAAGDAHRVMPKIEPPKIPATEIVVPKSSISILPVAPMPSRPGQATMPAAASSRQAMENARKDVQNSQIAVEQKPAVSLPLRRETDSMAEERIKGGGRPSFGRDAGSRGEGRAPNAIAPQGEVLPSTGRGQKVEQLKMTPTPTPTPVATPSKVAADPINAIKPPGVASPVEPGRNSKPQNPSRKMDEENLKRVR